MHLQHLQVLQETTCLTHLVQRVSLDEEITKSVILMYEVDPAIFAFVQQSFQLAQAMSDAGYLALQQGTIDPLIQTALNSVITTTGDPNTSPAQWGSRRSPQIPCLPM